VWSLPRVCPYFAYPSVCTIFRTHVTAPVSLSSHSISDYLDMRGYKHSRLDGSTNRVMREVRINLFNKPQSPQFIFCLSTRYVCVVYVVFARQLLVLFCFYVMYLALIPAPVYEIRFYMAVSLLWVPF
jgi:hypothetical protein